MLKVLATYLFSSIDTEKPDTMAVWKGELNNGENAVICETIKESRPNQKNITLLSVEITESLSSPVVRK